MITIITATKNKNIASTEPLMETARAYAPMSRAAPINAGIQFTFGGFSPVFSLLRSSIGSDI